MRRIYYDNRLAKMLLAKNFDTSMLFETIMHGMVLSGILLFLLQLAHVSVILIYIEHYPFKVKCAVVSCATTER